MSETSLAKPNDKAFANKGAIAGSNVIQPGAKFHIYEKMPDDREYPAEGGIYLHYKGLPYPKKGFPYPEAIFLNDTAKRFTMAWVTAIAQKGLMIPLAAFALLPRKRKVKAIERALEEYCKIGEYVLASCMLEDARYCNLCRGLNLFIIRFLHGIGVDSLIATRAAKVFITLVEYDDAYRLRFEDIMSTTSKTALTERPRQAVAEMVGTFIDREEFPQVKEKARSFGRLMSFALRIPRVRKAFSKAWEAMYMHEFEGMQLDEADRYHTLTWGSYRFQGLELDQRMRMFVQRHTRSKCCQADVSDTGVGTDETIRCMKCGKLCGYEHTFPPMVEVVPEEGKK